MRRDAFTIDEILGSALRTTAPARLVAMLNEIADLHLPALETPQQLAIQRAVWDQVADALEATPGDVAANQDGKRLRAFLTTQGGE